MVFPISLHSAETQARAAVWKMTHMELFTSMLDGPCRLGTTWAAWGTRRAIHCSSRIIAILTSCGAAGMTWQAEDPGPTTRILAIRRSSMHGGLSGTRISKWFPSVQVMSLITNTTFGTFTKSDRSVSVALI